MDLTNILQQLRAERDKIGAAIASLEAIGLASTAPKRRGRPPKNPISSEQDAVAPASAAPGRQRRKKRSPEQRAAQAERMRKYWADRKAQGE